GVDRRAVVALVVVLHHELPVGGDLVVVTGGGAQRLELPRRQYLRKIPELYFEWPRLARRIEEEEATPGRRRHLDQRELRLVEVGRPGEGGCAFELSVE